MAKKRFSAKWIWLIIMVCLISAVIISVSVYTYSSETIYAGVRCGGVSLSHLSEVEAIEALRNTIPKDVSGKKISLSFDGHEKEILLSDFDVSYDIEQTVSDAFKFGREGGFFTRTKNVFMSMLKGYNQRASFAYSKEKLDEEIGEMLQGIGTAVKEFSYEVEDGKFYIINGEPGDMPDSHFVSEEILKAAGELGFEEALVFEKKQREPSSIDVEKLYKELNVQPQNASYELRGGEVEVIPHKYSVVFDKGEAKKIIAANEGYGKRYNIPATVSEPDFLYEDAKKRLFSQTLGSYKSNYNQGDVSRSSNVSLAAKLVNSTIIMPGQEFSYNTVVGKRTAEAGFKVAHVYMNNEVVDGMGGGICQVSSTLYCAVLYANLEVVERVNHQLPVSYVPLGQDATVDYGNIDFRFRNNTPYPLRILSHASGGVMYASIEGYKDVKEDVEIIPVRIASIPPEVKEVEDPTLPFGEKKEEDKGSVGSVVETYKVVTVNGESKKTLISKSRYAAEKAIVRVGTGPTPSPSPEGAEETMGEAEAEESPKPSEVPESTPQLEDEE